MSWLSQGFSLFFTVNLSLYPNQDITINVTPIGPGDPDIYASLTISHPNAANARWTSRSSGEDSISIASTDVGGSPTLFITVYAFSDCNFTITLDTGLPTVLLNGYPQRAIVHRGAVKHFQFQALAKSNAASTPFYVAITPIAGQTALYIGNTRFPDAAIQSSYQWPASNTDFQNSFTIPSSNINYPSNGMFFITVVGAGSIDSQFVIYAGSNSSQWLVDGVPITSSLARGDIAYYALMFTPTTLLGCSISFTVTSLTGDPDLYSQHCSFDGTAVCNNRPSSSNYEKRSTAFGSDEIVYPQAAPTGLYYIGVHAFLDSTFVLTANTDCSGNHTVDFSNLIDGLPQSGTLIARQTRYYKYQVAQAGVDLVVSVSRRYGDPDLYMSVDNGVPPSPNGYTWKANSAGEDMITVSRFDSNACHSPPCTYYIAVYAFTDTAFTVIASLSSTITTLQAGVPISDYLTAGSFEYFQFIFDQPGRTITISVTDLGQGDPDLYVSTATRTPNTTSSMWHGVRYRSDSITIPPTDPNACQQRCTYYVGVHAFLNSSFTLVASYHDAVALQDGTPQEGYVEVEAVEYFFIDVTPGYGTVTVTLTPMDAGSASLYVSNSATYPEPNVPSTYQFTAPYYLSRKTITISETDQRACVPQRSDNSTSTSTPLMCRYTIGVFGITNTSFVLLTSTSASNYAVTLQNGVPQSGTLTANKWAYFTIRVENPGYDLTVVVTALSGDPDIFMTNVTSNARVNASNAIWKATRYGTDTIDIVRAAPGMYYIGVEASLTNTSFTVLALIQSDSPSDPNNRINLIDGQPQQGSLRVQRYAYYTFAAAWGLTAIEVSVTKLFGDPDLYMTAPGDTVPPSNRHFAWSSTGGGSDMLRINSPQPGVYTIAVYAYASSLYTISASSIGNNAPLTELQDSVPLRASLPRGVYKDYFIRMNSWKPLSIVVTPFSGDPDLYVALHPNPRPGNATWISTNWLDDSITIPTTDLNSCASIHSTNCIVFVSVYSFLASSYSVIASFSSVTYVQDGVPQGGSVFKGTFKYFALTPGADSTMTSLTISLTPQNGNPSLYVSTREQPTAQAGHYQQRIVGQYSGAFLVLTSSSPAWCVSTSSDGCIYYVGVYGETDSNFTLSMSSSGSSYMLQNGRPIREFLTTNTMDYFAFDVSNPNYNLLVSVTPITGDPDLFMSVTNPRPNMTNYDFASRQSGGDAILITNATVTRYYIGVHAYTNTSFTLLASTYGVNDTAQAVMLVDGVPQNSIVGQHNVLYYFFQLSGTHGELTIIVTPRVGDPDIYVSKDVQPSTSRYTWSSSQSGGDIVEIFNPVPGRYWIAIYGYTTADFSIVAKTDSSTLALLNGVPFRDSLQQGAWEYFVLPVDDSSLQKDLTIAVTALNGDPDIYVSRIHQRPNRTASEWRSTSYQSDAITIPAKNLVRGNYYVGVTAYTNCSFIIQANFNDRVQLQDGSPSSDSVAKLQMKYYSLRISNMLGAAKVNTIRLSLTPIRGRVYLFMSNRTDPIIGDSTTYNWASWQFSATQTITATRNDAAFCRDSICDYRIMVYGVLDSQYSIVALTDTAVHVLQNGVPSVGSVGTNAWQYYTFTAVNRNAAITYTLTPNSGNPDLYVNPPCTPSPIHSCEDRPGKNATWSSSQFGGDYVHIDFLDLHFGIGTWTIGVFGQQASQYTITAIATDLSNLNNTLIYLIDGQQQTSFSQNSSDLRYFAYYVPPSTDGSSVSVSFTVTPRYGDPDLFVKVGMNAPWPSPTGNYVWKSEDYGRDVVSIDDSCTDCYYVLAVSGYSKSLFDLVASSTSIQLLSGVPHFARVTQNSYNYYYITLDAADLELVVSVTALTGDPDIYVDDRDSVQRPNSTFYKWRSLDFGSDTLTILQPHAGFYYVSVHGYMNSTYIITATVGPVTLIDSEPYSDLLKPRETRYYTFTYFGVGLNPPPLNLLVDLQNSGSVDMFVCNNCTTPSATSYQWRTLSTDTGATRNSIKILPKDMQTCRLFCTFHIAVIAQSRAIYSIVASYSDIPMLLAAGKPVVTQVEQGTFAYFRAVVDDLSHDLNIVVTEFVGDAAIYADWVYMENMTSPDDNVTAHWITRPDSMSVGEHLGISHTDAYYVKEAYPGRQLFIGVYGTQFTRFSIVYTTRNQLLLPGQPAIATLDDSGYAEFVYNIDAAPTTQTTSDLVLSFGVANQLNNLHHMRSMAVGGVGDSSSYFKYWIINNASSTTVPGPNTDSYWSGEVQLGGSVIIYKNDAHACTTCTYFVTVSGTPQKQFTLTASTDSDVDLLFDNSALAGNVSDGQFKYYEIYIAEAQNFSTVVETCSGNADLFISRQTRRPAPGTAEWSSTNTDSIDSLFIASVTGIQVSSFFIGVRGTPPADSPGLYSSYYIHTRTSADPMQTPIVREPTVFASSNQANTVELQIYTAGSKRGDTHNKALQYTVYYQAVDAKKYVMYSQCGIMQTKPIKTLSYDLPSNSPVTIELTGLDSKRYEINVLVQDMDETTHVPLGSAVYKFTNIVPLNPDAVDSSAAQTLRILLIIGIPIAILIVALAAYLFYRNRRLTQELSIEMGDVPKGILAKAMRGPPSAQAPTGPPQTKNYSRLLPDDEVDDTSTNPTDYLPPTNAAKDRQAVNEGLTGVPGAHEGEDEI